MRPKLLLSAFCALFLATLGTASTHAASAAGGSITQPTASDLAWLKANNLDSKDPNLKAKIAALLIAKGKAAHQRLLALGGAITVTPLPPAHAGQQIGPQALVTLIARYRVAGSIFPPGPVINNVIVNNTWYGKAWNKEPDRPGPIVASGAAEIGEGDGVGIAGTGLQGASIELTFGNCGSLNLNIHSGDDQHVYASVPKFSVDEMRKTGILHVHASGGDTTFPVIFIATLLDVHASLSSGVYPNNADGGHAYNITHFLGFVEGSTMQTQDGDSIRQSVNPGWAGGEGDNGVDVFGIGEKLEHGWTATATAHVPNICTGETCGGHAILIQFPMMSSPTSFETKVAWNYDPLNYSTYVVDFKLRGPNGGVPLSSMPQQTNCNVVSF